MTTLEQSTPQDIVKQAFDEAKHTHRVKSFKALAKRYGLSVKTADFLRNGRWTRGDRLLIAALLGCRLDAPDVPQDETPPTMAS